MSFFDLVSDMDRAIQNDLGGVSVVYVTLSGGTANPDPVGMFDDNYQATKSDQSRMANSTPSVVFRLEDLPEDPRTTSPVSLTILAVAYSVRGYETDGVPGGSIRLNLRKL